MTDHRRLACLGALFAFACVGNPTGIFRNENGVVLKVDRQDGDAYSLRLLSEESDYLLVGKRSGTIIEASGGPLVSIIISFDSKYGVAELHVDKSRSLFKRLPDREGDAALRRRA